MRKGREILSPAPSSLSEVTLLTHLSCMEQHVVQHWYDPETKRALPGTTEEDSWGTDLIGQDSEGKWWGTPRALWVISPGKGCKTFIVTGYLGSETYVLYLRAKHKSVALDYAICHGVKGPMVVEG